jgi:hypothetical protein
VIWRAVSAVHQTTPYFFPVFMFVARPINVP